MKKTKYKTASEPCTIPANKLSMSKRRLVQGFGINDSPYLTDWIDDDGNGWRCPAQRAWKNMIKRCRCSKHQEKHPTYIGCSVSEEWRHFTAFRSWFSLNWVQGWELDKDILKPGNKVYSPSTCAYVPSEINVLLTDSAASRGDYPQGVWLRKDTRKFRASVSSNGKSKPLGCFTTPEEAEICYLRAKADEIEKAVKRHPRLDARVVNSLHGTALDLRQQALIKQLAQLPKSLFSLSLT